MKSQVSRPAWFKAFVSKYRRSVALALALGLAASGFAALLMFTSGYLISATAQPGITLFSIMVPVACVQLFGIGRPFARYLERLVSHNWVLRVTSDLRRLLYWSIEKRAGDPASARSVGEYLGVLSDDIAHLQNLYLRVVFPTAIAYLLVLGASVVFGFFSVPFALVMLLMLALVAGLLPYASLLATRAATERVKAMKADAYAKLTDDVLGATDWILAGRSQEVVASHVALAQEMRAIEARVRLVQRAISFAATLLLSCGVCLVIAWSGSAFSGSLPAANWIAAFTLGFFPLIEALALLPGAVSQAPIHEDSIGRLDVYLGEEMHAEPCDVASGGDGVGTENDAGEGDASESCDLTVAKDGEGDGGDSCFGGVAGSDFADDSNADEACASSGDKRAIVFENVTYVYPHSESPVLDGFSLVLRCGEKTAILGKSGSGKSTFANMARGSISPCTGTVRTAGRIGYLDQSPYLFNRSLRENLTLGVLEAKDEELMEALASVGLREKAESLEGGLDTIVGETGVGFSGGEAHRIALARVLVADYPIVIVDEPFAALDPETEQALLDTLFETCANRTLLVITHHLAQIERFDRVVFVEDGRVDLDDSPAHLMETSPRFRMLVEFDRSQPVG